MHQRLLTSMWLGLTTTLATAQPAPSPTYSPPAQVTQRLQTLAARSGGIATFRSLGKSAGGQELPLITIGRGNVTAKPALLVVAGLDGTHLAGTELAVQLAEKMLTAKSDSVTRLLDTKTIYILPLLNPDAQAQAFGKLRYERSGNGSATDDDRDGRTDEDGPEDLNGDGLITQVRIEDPTGQYVPSKDDPRVLVKADPAKGEVGRYVLITEGIDNDKDGQFNEDGPGGVALDKAFTFDYPFFTPGAGEMPASELESRALLDFLYKTPNIYAVFTLGPYNNLSEAPKFDRAKTAKRIVTGLLEKDATVGEQVSKLYNAQTGLSGAPAMPATRGNFAQTAYYHAGRLSFSTPGWWLPKPVGSNSGTGLATQSARRDTTGGTARPTAPSPAGATTSSPGATASAGASENDDVKTLRWTAANGVSDAFMNWTAVQHPDFPGRKAEVGGLTPFVKNPPVRLLTDAADRHARFLTAFAARMPQVEIVNVRTEALGGGVSRVTAQVVNRGLLPTGAEMGDRVRYVPKLRIELVPGNGQTVVSGRRRILRGPLAAGEVADVTFLITGTGRARLEAGSAMTGISSTDLNL